VLASGIRGTANVDWQISDAMCKADHGMMQKDAMKMSDK
jgi:hypothetical protein